MKKLYIKTYGCQMNFYDSEQISNLLSSSGYNITENSEDADLIVLNTCHIRDKAVEKTFSDLGRIKKSIKLSNNNKLKPIVAVAGCVAQAQGEEIMKRSPWVDIVVGPQSYTDLPSLISKVNKVEKKELVNLDFPTIPKFDHLDQNVNEKKISSFLTIQEGCDKFCSFCVVPYTRGPEYSRSIESIMMEVKKLIKRGTREIILLGQNVNAWTSKGNQKFSLTLGNLIDEISKCDEILSIRYTTSHPLDMDLKLIETHQKNKKLMPYLHLPIQSGSNNILSKMNRKHTVEDYLKIIEKVKEYRPDIAISSDFIVGFPGETDQDHRKTLKLINEVKFASSYSFKYSPRPGTPSADFEKQVDEKIKNSRLQELQGKLKKHQLVFNQKSVNSKMSILILYKNKKNQYIGKSPYNQTVIIDEKLESNQIFLNRCKKVVGQIIDVRITNSFQNSLEGEFSIESLGY
ncbi:MAG: tRNA (N6-isopentenyl adenosine(37)-C2)-methylthiotransferase MiaB [SAR116 cluster bacterium]|nr:tRNA (N6-isopentenyl adenosine(37)-C2)-methylthiotransferase MiaB [SAR116 cluster bacterium]